jgi:hypothetical protein
MTPPHFANRKSLSFCGATSAALFCLIAAWAGSRSASAPDAPGALKLSVIDEATKQPTPARVEVLDQDGKAFIADDALLIGGD